MYKRIEIILLPNLEARDCVGLIKCIKDWTSFISPEEDFAKVGDLAIGVNTSVGVFDFWQPQYPYVLSTDDDIREGDWVNSGNDVVKVTPQFYQQLVYFRQYSIVRYKSYKKIFACGNPALNKDGIPTIGKDFIKEYVKRKGRGDVFMETIRKDVTQYEDRDGCSLGYSTDVPKTVGADIVLKFVDEEKIMLKPNKMKQYKFFKALQNISIFCLVHLFMTAILFGAIAMDYLLVLDAKSSMLIRMLQGAMNNKMLAIMCAISVPCIILIAANAMFCGRFIIGNLQLEDEKEKYRKATAQMQNARDKYTEVLKQRVMDESKLSRVEVIAKSREYVNMNTGRVELSFQDDGRTLKIFVEKGKN